jgi:hypothetical protein
LSAGDLVGILLQNVPNAEDLRDVFYAPVNFSRQNLEDAQRKRDVFISGKRIE